MVATIYMRVMDQKVTIICQFTLCLQRETAFVKGIRKKDIINNIYVLMIIIKLEPLEWQPVTWPARFNFPIITGRQKIPSPAATRRCLWPTPPPLSSSRTSATVSERGAISRIRWHLYGPLTVHYPPYRCHHPHLGLKSYVRPSSRLYLSSLLLLSPETIFIFPV